MPTTTTPGSRSPPRPVTRATAPSTRRPRRYVVAVGGTTLTLGPSNSYGAETAWSGSGSGCSALLPARTWQLSDPGWALTGCGIFAASPTSPPTPPPKPAPPSTTRPKKRGGRFKVGGTSLSAPLIAAVYALAGGGEGEYPAAGLYAHEEDSPASLHDVTSGSNGSCGGTKCARRRPATTGRPASAHPGARRVRRAAEAGAPLTLKIQEGEGTVVSDPAGIECTGSEAKNAKKNSKKDRKSS